MRYAPFTVLPFLLFGCTDLQSPTLEQQPQYNFSNGPALPGVSVVSRSGNPAIWIAGDGARDLVSVNGLGTLDPSNSWPCSGTEPFDIIDVQYAFTSAGNRLNAVVENPTQHIYAGVANFNSQPTLCDALSLPRVAEGIGNHFRIDGTCSGGCDQHVATGSVRAQGTLTDLVSGGLTRYTEEQRWVYNFSTGELKWVTENIRLTPMGTH